MVLGAVLTTTAMVVAPIVLGLHLTGVLPLPAGLLYGLAVPMTLLFVGCLIKFPWGTKVIMIVCTGGLFMVSFHVVKGIREKQKLPLTPALGLFAACAELCFKAE
ncbi:MAG: hypothetical protein JWR15_1599 [Prosthecobacter sp.]|nr:hypothetical protein [Prosthecobacter sp.]